MTYMHMKRHSTLATIRNMTTEVTVAYHSHPQEWPKFKVLVTSNIGMGLQESVRESSQMGHHLLATCMLRTPARQYPALPGEHLEPPNSVPSCTITAVITIPSGTCPQAQSPCFVLSPPSPPWLSSRTSFPRARTATRY